MNIRNKLLPVTAASAVILGAAVSAHADPSVSLQVLDTGAYSVNQSAGTYGGSSIGAGNIGIYSFQVTSSSSPGTTGLTPGETIYSICLSPLGEVPGGSSLYSVESYSEANAGLNPALWSWNHVAGPGAQYWGIENAQYLWRDIANAGQPGLGGISALSTMGRKDAGAALALAIYTVLYDSTGYGTYTETPSNYKAPAIGGAELLDYTADLALLTPGGVMNNIGSGYALVPADTSGQDLIYVNPNGSKLNPPVPEPTTMVAGVLLALPFGASTLRILRKKSIA